MKILLKFAVGFYVCILFSMFFLSSSALAQGKVSGGLPLGASKWLSECNAKQAGSCFNLGLQHKTGVATPINPRRAAEYFTKACKLKHRQGCANAVEQARDKAKDNFLYGQALEAGCENGGAEYCGEGMQFFLKQNTTQYDPFKGSRLLEKGCDLGDGYMCQKYAMLFDINSKHSRLIYNASHAQKGYTKACRYGEKYACYLAIMYNSGSEMYIHDIGIKPTVRNYPYNSKNLKMSIREACDRKIADGCDVGAYVYSRGEWQQIEDVAKAKNYAKMGCDLGNEYSCSVALFYADKMISKKLPEFQKYSKIMCQFNDGRACHLYANSLAAQNKESEAQTLWEKSCSLGQNNVCDWLKNEAVRVKDEADKQRQYEEYMRQFKVDAQERRRAFSQENANSGTRRPSFQLKSWIPPVGPSTYKTTPFGNSASQIRNWNKYQCYQGGSTRC